jgi:hypothetical protein
MVEQPTSTVKNPYLDREDVLGEIRAAFASRDPSYDDRRYSLSQRLRSLNEQLAQQQRKGHAMACAEQIALEAQWLLNYREDWPRAARRIERLAQYLADPPQGGPRPDPDGSWGGCCTEWYRKLEPTVDALQGDLTKLKLVPLAFMQRLADPGWTLDYLFRLQITDIARTGVNQRDELGAVQSALCQLIFKKKLRRVLATNPVLGFDISDELELRVRDYLDQTQHPRTGYWCELAGGDREHV